MNDRILAREATGHRKATLSRQSVKTNARAIEGLALETWHLLTMAQRTALRQAYQSQDGWLERRGGLRLKHGAHARTVAALTAHELADDGRWLTPLGLLVREAGIAETQKQARRRYAARLRGQS